jgi:hypothetical protein
VEGVEELKVQEVKRVQWVRSRVLRSYSVQNEYKLI